MTGRTQLLGAGVLSDSLGAFRHCVLGQFSRQEETNSSLDLPRGDGRPIDQYNQHQTQKKSPLVVMGQLASFCSNPLEQVVDKRVHDGHGL